ncbi:MAG: four helix bundle protein [Spirosomaceae bacterium]|nr:four helix bundle protein [Spirosomataceae bacterium]
MRNFKELLIWQRSHKLTLHIYKIVSTFPSFETFGLISQMRRSSYSIPTNISEGCGRNSNPELVRFLNISMGSANELEYQLLLSRDLEYLDNEIYLVTEKELVEVKKMMNTFIQSVKKQIAENKPPKS